MKNLFFLLGKHLFMLSVFGLVVGRLVFPKTLEETVIAPARKLPIFGQVLGITWDKMGQVGPSVTQKTVDLADKIEKTDLPIDETIAEISKQDSPGKAASALVEKQVDQSVSKIKNLPANILEEAKKQVRKEMYKEICQDWLATPEPSPNP